MQPSDKKNVSFVLAAGRAESVLDLRVLFLMRCRKKLDLQGFMYRISKPMETATGEAPSGGLSFGSVSDS